MALLPLRFSRCCFFVVTLFAFSAFASTTPPSHPLKPAVAQGAGGGFWRVDHSFKSTIAVTNVLEIAPITVTPVLYMADGTRYALDPVTLEVAGVASVDINQALSKAPAAIRSHISDFGSASIEYMWSWSGAVFATVENLDVARSLVFHFPMRVPPSKAATPGKITTEGLWWKHDNDIGGFVAVTNTTKIAITAHLSVFPSGPGRHSERELALAPSSTQRIDLTTMLSEIDKASEGGLTITYKGGPSDLNISGGLENPAIGYSAKIPFATKGGTPDTSQFMTASVGVMVGDADPMMMFPAGTRFIPYAVFRNISTKKALVAPSVQYMESGQAKSARLQPFELKGNESLQMDVPKALAKAGLDKLSGEVTLMFSSNGLSDDLLLATGSVDQTGTYVFEVECKGVGASDAKMLAKWSVADGNDTMVSLWNSGDKDQDLNVTLYFSGGQYKVPVHLAKNASSMFNVSEIIMMQQPDSDGNTIQASAQSGSAVLSGAKGESEHINVSVSVGTFNVKTATCGTTCPTCLGYTNYYVSPTPNSTNLGSSLSYAATAINQRGGSSDQTFNSSWSSDNSSIGSSQGSGTYSAVGVGSFTATAYIVLMDPNPDCPATGHSPCPTSPWSGPGSGSVFPTVQISGNANIPMLAAGTTGRDNVTLTATGNPSGGTYQWSAVSGGSNVTLANATTANVIVKSVAVGTATIRVDYTLNGQSGSQVFPVLVQQPGALAVFADTGSFFGWSCRNVPPDFPPYTGVERQITYTVMDTSSPSKAIPADGMHAVESFSPVSNGCQDVADVPNATDGLTLGTGNFPSADTFAMCSVSCLPADSNDHPMGSCSVKVNQTWKVNGFSVQTKQINYQCSTVTLQ